MNNTLDKWADWVLKKRQGGDQNYQAALKEFSVIRDKLILGCRLKSNDVVLDVGCGDGLLGFGALEKVKEQGNVIFCDISDDLLNYCRTFAENNNVANNCSFINSNVETLHNIQDSSIDCIVLRSVLIYVKNKHSAFQAMYRVLKPGGRIAMCEPVNIFFVNHAGEWRYLGFDLTPVKHLAEKAIGKPAKWSQEEIAEDTMLNFDERDLMGLAWGCGFTSVNIQYEATSEKGGGGRTWDTIFKAAPNPNVQSLEDRLKKRLSETEIEEFITHFKPQVEKGNAVSHFAQVCLFAIK